MQVTTKKMRTFAEVHDQNLHHATLLNAVFPFSEEFQCGLFAEICYKQLTTVSIA